MKYLEDKGEYSNTEWRGIWSKVLEYGCLRANFVSFNVLYDDKELQIIVERYNGIFKNVKKEYNSGRVIFFPMTENLKSYLLDETFDFWENNFIEDLSFWDGNTEFISTISHEGYLILNIKAKEESYFKGIGFMLSVQMT